MARAILTVFLLLLSIGPALAQPAPIDPPVAGRPENFSNIVGDYKISVAAQPTDVGVEESIKLRIWITGIGPEKYVPKRKYLQLFPAAWERDFYVLPLPDEDAVDREKTGSWLFVYRLKPKHDKITAIDGITLWTYNPNRPGKMKFVPDFAKPIAIKVKPKVEKTDIEFDVQAVPDSFYTNAESKDAMAWPTTIPMNGWQLAVLLALPPFACLVGVLAWRRYFPDDAQVMSLRRGAAALRATDRLQADSARAWEVVRQYLAECFDFLAIDPTPADVSAFLKRRGFAKTLCEESRAFFQACDAVRFAQREPPRQLADDASRLIHNLEADPCARG
ncbi:MAG: hypothetical protein EXR98_02165 [Gemmataceae bacterium]|nr:hypothetical protein [Gemmataceae bacterium]